MHGWAGQEILGSPSQLAQDVPHCQRKLTFAKHLLQSSERRVTGDLHFTTTVWSS